jgi:hypothetical protein
MTTLQNRPITALLTIDMQVGVITKAVGRDAFVMNVASLVAKACTGPTRPHPGRKAATVETRDVEWGRVP